MRAVRLLDRGGPSGVVVEEIDRPVAAPGEALVRVRAAAITRDELDWPVDRLPAIPSYELSGVVEAVGSDVAELTPGYEIFALTPFDRDGVAAEYAAVPADILAPKPKTIDHVESAAIPMGALTAWQGLFVRGGLGADQRVLILGAAGGVGHLAVQLARSHGARCGCECSRCGRSLGACSRLGRSLGRSLACSFGRSAERSLGRSAKRPLAGASRWLPRRDAASARSGRRTASPRCGLCP